MTFLCTNLDRSEGLKMGSKWAQNIFKWLRMCYNVERQVLTILYDANTERRNEEGRWLMGE